jgi:hypothetical protein
LAFPRCVSREFRKNLFYRCFVRCVPRCPRLHERSTLPVCPASIHATLPGNSRRTQKKRSLPRRRTHERLHGARPACKPGSVGRCRPDGHSSRIVIAHDLEQPTRGVFDETGHLSPPIRPCSDRGLPCRTCCQMRGGLLPHRFTLTGNNPPAVCFLWHFPSLQRSAQPLAGGPPFGARTFLGELTPHATVRPASH